MQQKLSKLKIIIPLCMIIFIDTFAMTLVYPIFAPLFSLDVASGGFFAANISLSLKDFLYGLTMAIYPIFMFFTSPLLGDLSDKIGRKKVLLICLIGAGIGAVISGFAVIVHSFTIFFISRMLAGAVAGSLPVAQAAITDISEESDKTINISLVGFSYTLGIVFGPIVGGILSDKNIVSWFTLSTPFFVTTAFTICNAIMLVLLFKETLLNIAKKLQLANIQIIKPILMFIEAFKNKIIRNVILVCFCYMMGWNMYMQFIALHLFQNFKFTATQIGYFIGWIGIVMSLTAIIIIRILTKFLTTKQILLLAILFSILGVLIGIVHNVAFQWISAVPIAIGLGLAYATIVTLFSDAVAPNLQGWIMGVSASVMAAAAGVGGLLTGVVSTNPILAFVTIVFVWLLCLVFFLQMKPKNAF